MGNLIWELFQKCVTTESYCRKLCGCCLPLNVVVGQCQHGIFHLLSRIHHNACKALNFEKVEIFMLCRMLHIGFTRHRKDFYSTIKEYLNKVSIHNALLLHLFHTACAINSRGSYIFTLCQQGCIAEYVQHSTFERSVLNTTKQVYSLSCLHSFKTIHLVRRMNRCSVFSQCRH